MIWTQSGSDPESGIFILENKGKFYADFDNSFREDAKDDHPSHKTSAFTYFILRSLTRYTYLTDSAKFAILWLI